MLPAEMHIKEEKTPAGLARSFLSTSTILLHGGKLVRHGLSLVVTSV